jgi:hypothetical protein
MLIAALCACSGFYLRHLRPRAIRPCAQTRRRELYQPAACGHRTTDTVESTDCTESVPSSPSVFQWCQGARRAVNGGDDQRSLPRYALATVSVYGGCGCGPPGPAPTFAGVDFAKSAACGHRTTDTVDSTDCTDSVLSSRSVFQWCQGTRRAVNGENDKCSLPRYALTTASIYGVFGCGPSGPAPKFAGANFSNAGAVIRHHL